MKIKINPALIGKPINIKAYGRQRRAMDGHNTLKSDTVDGFTFFLNLNAKKNRSKKVVKNRFIDKCVVYRTFSVFLRLCPFAPADIVLARKNSVHGFKSTSGRSLAICFGPKLPKNLLG